MGAGHHVEFGGVVALGRPVGRHGGVAALRVAGKHDLARQAGTHRGRSRPCRAHRVNHRGGLRVGMQVRVVGMGGFGKTQVVGGHHRIALGRVHGGQQESFAVLRVGQGARLLHVGSLGIGHQRGGRGTRRAPRHQHHAGRVGFVAAPHTHGDVVQRHHLDIALGLATEGLQACGRRAGVDLCSRQRGHGDGRFLEHPTLGAVRATAGDKQRRSSGHTGKAKIRHEWFPQVGKRPWCLYLRCLHHWG